MAVSKGFDICEPLWANERELEVVAARCIEVVSASNKDDPSQVDRVAGWLDKALSALAAAPAQNLKAVRFLTVAWGNLRERQRRYQDAETLYRRAIEKGDPDAISYNNLAWLLALNDRKGEAALEYINKAIALKGLLPEFLDTRGVIYLSMGGKTQLAIDDLEKVVAADPSASKLFHLAQGLQPRPTTRRRPRGISNRPRSRASRPDYTPLNSWPIKSCLVNWACPKPASRVWTRPQQGLYRRHSRITALR